MVLAVGPDRVSPAIVTAIGNTLVAKSLLKLIVVMPTLPEDEPPRMRNISSRLLLADL